MKKVISLVISVVMLLTCLCVNVNATVVLYNNYTSLGNVKGYAQLSATPSLSYSEVGTASASSHSIYASNHVLNSSGFGSGEPIYTTTPALGTTYSATATRYYTFPNGYKAYGTYEVDNVNNSSDYWYDDITLVRGQDF
jgi:hypothetical protein